MTRLTLISHALCPYVQRVAIALAEKGLPFDRRTVDLANKPDWFLALSPLGKTPVLVVGDTPIFESAVILEYLEETTPHPLHPADPLTRARHRAWIEVASAILNDIAGLYSAPDAAAYDRKHQTLRQRFAQVEAALGPGPWFGGAGFSLVDAAFAPVFRYIDAFDRHGTPRGLLAGLTRTARWRADLARRPSVRDAVTEDFPERLDAFLLGRQSWLSFLMVAEPAA